jgi:hypothetical protein
MNKIDLMGFSGFDGESRPTPLPRTRAVSQTKVEQ